MKTRIDNESRWAAAEILNEMYAAGYRFYCEGDYKVSKTKTDPWSGMPEVDRNLYFFDDKNEAEAFAKTQRWAFNKTIHPDVYEIPEHTDTWEEEAAKKAAKKAKAKATKEANERKKAEALGITVEELRAEKKRIAYIKRCEKTLEEIDEQLKELQRKKQYWTNELNKNKV